MHRSPFFWLYACMDMQGSILAFGQNKKMHYENIEHVWEAGSIYSGHLLEVC